jgi:hypothetical protein
MSLHKTGAAEAEKLADDVQIIAFIPPGGAAENLISNFKRKTK